MNEYGVTKLDEDYYVDGGVRVNTPVEVLKRMGADKVIAVTFDCNKRPVFSIENVVGISTQAYNIMTHSINLDEIAKQIASQFNINIDLDEALNKTATQLKQEYEHKCLGRWNKWIV